MARDLEPSCGFAARDAGRQQQDDPASEDDALRRRAGPHPALERGEIGSVNTQTWIAPIGQAISHALP
jgi:hypothetical protein